MEDTCGKMFYVAWWITFVWTSQGKIDQLSTFIVILECRFGFNSILKINSWGEDCTLIVYFILVLFLVNVGLVFFSIHLFTFNTFWVWCMDKMISESIPDSFKGSLVVLFTHQIQKVLNVKRYIERNPSPILRRDKIKTEHISEA